MKDKTGTPAPGSDLVDAAPGPARTSKTVPERRPSWLRVQLPQTAGFAKTRGPHRRQQAAHRL